jgi:uncharacterized protein YdeI (YjbR/CyaY-like superfamily)
VASFARFVLIITRSSCCHVIFLVSVKNRRIVDMSMETIEAPRVYQKDRKAWRVWLQKNHAHAKGVWLVYDKAGERKRTLSPSDISEEAICFGWIDSVPRSLSSTQAMIYVSPRKPKSNWSKLNRERAERMIREGEMTAAGKAMIELAKKTGTWTALVGVQKSVIPKDLKAAFAGNKKAKRYFDAFPPSSKRIILEWILNAKLPETRAKRIEETVRLAAKNIRANHYRQ